MKHGLRLITGELIMAALLLGLVAPLGQASLAAGAIIYVDADATGGGDGTSWMDAFTELQPALETAAVGDQIWVAAGIYKPTVEHGGTGDRYRSFQMKNGVAIYGGFDPSMGDEALEERDWVGNLTVLSGDLNGDDEPNFTNYTENSYHVFYHPPGTNLDDSAILDGFTITGGNATGLGAHTQGGGMYNYYSGPALTNVIFRLNSANFGGGMFNDNVSEPVLRDTTFDANLGGAQGGGMANYFLSNPRLVGVTFNGNFANTGGGMYNYYQSNPILINTAFVGNFSGYEGGGMANDDHCNPTLTNVTFAGNDAGMAGGMYNAESNPILTNAIFWSNGTTQISNSSSTPVISYSDIQGGCPAGATCNHVINLDPQFVNAAFGNLRLQPTSPVIEAGNNAAVVGITTDLDGSPRLVDYDNSGDAQVDMGAYEAQLGSDILYVDKDAPGPVHDGTSWDSAFTGLQAGLAAAVAGNEIWVAEGVYTPGVTGNRYATFQLKDGVALYGGFSGTETQRQERNWSDNATILSGDLDHNHVLDAGNAYHVVSGDGLSTTAVLDGFTITGGNANGTAPHNNGGGMYNVNNSNPVLSNLTFSGNATFNIGGGMYNYASSPALRNITFISNIMIEGLGGGMGNDGGSPTLTNVSFIRNSAVSGGGMNNSGGGSPVLTNVSFNANTASDSGGGMHNDSSVAWLWNVQFTGNQAMQGGGMYNNVSNPMLYNVTFAGNTSGFPGGGMTNNQSYPTLYNCIVWANIPDQISNSDSRPSIYYSDIQDGCPLGAECSQVINLDPQFMRSPAPGADGAWGTADDDYGDLRLRLTSPAIDAGVNSIVPPDIITDLLGFPRFVDILSVLDTGFGTPPIVDMGAYEAQAVVVYLPLVTK